MFSCCGKQSEARFENKMGTIMRVSTAAFARWSPLPLVFQTHRLSFSFCKACLSSFMHELLKSIACTLVEPEEGPPSFFLFGSFRAFLLFVSPLPSPILVSPIPPFLFESFLTFLVRADCPHGSLSPFFRGLQSLH